MQLPISNQKNNLTLPKLVLDPVELDSMLTYLPAWHLKLPISILSPPDILILTRS
jgi:hypothetical protein